VASRWRELIPPTLRGRLRDARGLHPEHGRAGIGTSLLDSGSNDGLVSAEQAQEWRKATSSEFSFIELPGDHMYLADRAQGVLDLIEAKSVDG
jgi:surfactin synthase thioesterase subunit